jgi:tetratricopeptide (TPR) repeat protein
MNGATVDMETSASNLSQSLRDRYGVTPNIVVYGQIALKDGDYVVTPRFYVSDKLYEARDVYGGFTMGPVVFGSSFDETMIKSGELANRSRALTYITQGILQLVAADFESAHSTLQKVIDLKLEPNHSELIFTLMGNATLAQLDTEAGRGKAADFPHRLTLLDRADQDFANAITQNSAYARGYLGRASVLYLRYLQPAIAQGDWSLISDTQLAELDAAYQSALTASEKPITADLPEKVKFGLGQVAVVRYLRGDQAQWQPAKTAFETVITAYDKMVAAKSSGEIRLQALTAESYNRIGLLWEKAGKADEARAAYQKAVDTIGNQPQYRARRDVLRRSLIAFDIGQLRTAGKVDDAVKRYEDLFAIQMPDADAMAYRYGQAKMLDEATPSRPGDAVAVLQKALALNLTDNPVLAAQLYRFLGDLYYGELNQTPQALTAYRQALKLDPTGQANLQSLIVKLTGATTPTATMIATATP